MYRIGEPLALVRFNQRNAPSPALRERAGERVRFGFVFFPMHKKTPDHLWPGVFYLKA